MGGGGGGGGASIIFGKSVCVPTPARGMGEHCRLLQWSLGVKFCNYRIIKF